MTAEEKATVFTQKLSESTAGRKNYPPPTAQYKDFAQSSELFWGKLKDFHKSFGTKFMVPTVGGKALDLHHLFVEVTSRGGLEKVIRDRKWKEVMSVFNFPTTITSASFVLRKYYLSLLYHFEQVYCFHKQVPSVLMPDHISRNLGNGSANLGEGATINHLPGHASLELQIGCSVNGTIDGKFDNGYLVTVNLGSDELQGVLYHIPHMSHGSQTSYNLAQPPRRNRKRSRLALRDPSHPKSNKSGYNLFFTEHYTKLKPLYYGQEKILSNKIGLLWNNLTEAEKQVYQQRSSSDKERYRTELLEYRSSYDSHPC